MGTNDTNEARSPVASTDVVCDGSPLSVAS